MASRGKSLELIAGRPAFDRASTYRRLGILFRSKQSAPPFLNYEG